MARVSAFYLTSASGLYGALSYSYDAVGKRLTQSGGDTNLAQNYTYAANSNQLFSVVNGETTRSLAFTAAGNLATDNNGAGTVLSFSYNQQNRLVQVANQNTALDAFQQNFLGERVVKSTSAGVFDFHYDEAGHLIAESDGTTGAVRNEYIWRWSRPGRSTSSTPTISARRSASPTPTRTSSATRRQSQLPPSGRCSAAPGRVVPARRCGRLSPLSSFVRKP